MPRTQIAAVELVTTESAAQANTIAPYPGPGGDAMAGGRGARRLHTSEQQLDDVTG
jgi:hypothetical protein